MPLAETTVCKHHVFVFVFCFLKLMFFGEPFIPGPWVGAPVNADLLICTAHLPFAVLATPHSSANLLPSKTLVC